MSIKHNEKTNKKNNVVYAKHWLWGNKKMNVFPYAIGLLTAVLKDKYEVEILDANINNLSIEQIFKKVSEYKPDVFGISCRAFTHADSYDKTISIAKKAYPKTITIAGGAHATVTPDLMMKNEDLDFIVMGLGI